MLIILNSHCSGLSSRKKKMLAKLFQEVVKNLTRFINFWKTVEKPPNSYLVYYSG